MLLTYLMTQEAKERGDSIEEEFRSLIFANAVAHHVGPDLYLKLFNDEVDEEELEFVVPQNEGEVAAMMRDFQSLVPPA